MLTEVIFVIDKSGSMSKFKEDTIGGFNSFIDKQRDGEGDVNLTLVQFNHDYHPIFESKKINEIEYLTEQSYIPEGTTALLDAVGRTIDDIGKVFDKREGKPENVIFCITTDGLENSSSDYTKDMIKEKVEHQTNNYGWNFIFFGANIDSFAEADSIGVHNTTNYDFTSKGTRALYSTLSTMTDDLRTTGELHYTTAEYYDKENK